jgi:ankyrin repeat protein
MIASLLTTDFRRGMRAVLGLIAAGGVGTLYSATPPAPASATANATIDEAIARGDLDSVKQFLDRDASLVRGKPDAKLSPLHQAILRRQSKIVVLLLERGADVQAPDSSGRTPLHLAVERADAGIVKELLRRKADPTKRDRIGWTPLHHAAAKNRMEIATLLLDSGMDPNLRSELGGTALHEAAASGVVEMVNLLLARGIDPTVRSKPGVTALDLAKEYKHPEVVAILEKKR